MRELLQEMLADGRICEPDLPRLTHRFPEGGPPPGEADVLRWVAAEYDVAFDGLSGFEPETALLAALPPRLLLQWDLLPLRRADGVVELATARLFDCRGMDALRIATGETFRPVLAPVEAIRACIRTHLGVGADTIDALEPASFLTVVDDRDGAGVDLEESAQDASIIRFVNQILIDAIEQRSTDVHLEPFEDEFRIRYRIDGVLQEASVPPQLKRFQPAVVSRIKIVSGLDIAEKRLPQDGRIKLRLKGVEVDVRVSTIPMVHGEAVVLRLLRQDGALRGLGELQMPTRELASLRSMLRTPHGIILVTGPTGSGKTTTLYAALQELNDSERKIITIEDPVEYQVKGINQIQVSERTGLDFARGLRAILRHDPDVVLIGEIRDAQTARIAVQASLTGHLVFSTLHTNDAPSAVIRLVDMGVEPYLVASSVEGVLAQRLVRVLCPDCKRPLTPEERRGLPAALGADGSHDVYEAVGCPKCRQTGYAGRRAIFELMPLDEPLRGLVSSSRSSGELCAAATQRGWRPLVASGWQLVREGVTTVEEVLRVSRDTSHGESACPVSSTS